MGDSEQFPSPFNINNISQQTTCKAIINRHKDHTITYPQSHLTPLPALLNNTNGKSISNSNGNITTNNFTTSINNTEIHLNNKFKAKDAEDVIDWIDSLKSRYEQLIIHQKMN